MAEAVVSIALETFRDLLMEEARFLSGVGDQVKALETQLKEIRCFLDDADKRRHESKTIFNYIVEVQARLPLPLRERYTKHMKDATKNGSCFESFAWFSAMSDSEDILRPQRNENVPTNTALMVQLCKMQRDDLWETSHRDGLKHVHDLWSKILVATRQNNKLS